MEKEITDIDGILKVVSALFGKLPVCIIHENKELPVKIIALKNKALIINSALKFTSKARILTLVHNGSKFLAQFTLVGGDGNGIEVLQPLKISIRPATRQGNRVEVADSANGSLRVTNLINIVDITKAIGFDDKKVDLILLAYRAKLAKIFPTSSIYFAGRADNRLRLMQHYDKSIYIIDRKNKSTANPLYLPFDEYLRIFDTSKLADDLISEIALPIRYKGYMSLGYIQVLSDKPLDMEVFNQITLFSQAISRDIVATGVFQESKENCPVIDLSSGGISFLHAPTRAFSRNVTMNGTIIFDLVMNADTKATFRGVIKNIRNLEANYRVGCQFYHPNVRDQEILETYLGVTSPTPEEGIAKIPDDFSSQESTSAGDQKEELDPMQAFEDETEDIPSSEEL
ncbi:PilZ domain-containing protein [Leptospira ognonensis]|uniref:PilZ domain-containing protein n=1 Tax=Leptospira ognonensis TaxID=2484945 RepID=A0A4R9JYE2_9LEPT|nr:PilZ domain-containing protein [Leptospira ognonensis]TGL58251.1 PilZ domain-containing protein [Leptospira ognonensis]